VRFAQTCQRAVLMREAPAFSRNSDSIKQCEQ
jgi:hypothetical protein